jgi:tRNA threonylcarbamoyl adenosine modification protein YeaZ
MASLPEFPDGVLAIEMSGDSSSLAVSKDGKILESDFTDKRGRSLITSLDSLLKTAHFSQADLSAILVGIGPGSYTGLRIACAGAKTLGYALEIPVVGVGSFEVSAWHALTAKGASKEIHLVLDAYRKEVYHAVFQLQNDELVVSQEAKVCKVQDFADGFPNQAHFLGDPKWTDGQGICLGENVCPSAAQILTFVLSKKPREDWETHWESPNPRYLRPAAYPPAS